MLAQIAAPVSLTNLAARLARSGAQAYLVKDHINVNCIAPAACAPVLPWCRGPCGVVCGVQSRVSGRGLAGSWPA